MKIAIVGVGGVGGVFGAALAEAGNDVHLIARGPHLEALRTDGLRITGAREIHVKPVNATDTPADIGPCDVVLLTVKLWSLQEVAATLAPLLHEDTAIVTLQNGVEAPDMLSEIVDKKHVMGGVAEVSAAIEGPGVVGLHSPYARLRFGELDGSDSPRGQALEAACTDAGVEAELSSDIQTALWRKFMLLVPMSGFTSVTRSTFGAVCGDPDTRALIEECLREIMAIAQAKGIAVSADDVGRIMSFLGNMPPQGRASMAIDLDRGNRLELPWLSGAVVRFGREMGIPTPVNSFINTALKFHQDGRAV